MKRIRFKTFKQIFEKLTRQSPVVIVSIQTGILISIGDFVSQTVVEQKKLYAIDTKRNSIFFLIGVGLVGPSLYVWYKFLDKYIGKAPLIKVAMDQLIFAPCFLVIFISASNILHGRNLEHIKNELREKYFEILFTNYTIWPIMQLINFKFIPLSRQVLFVQTIAIFWNAYLCWKTHI